MGYYGDLIFLLPALILSFYAQYRVQSTFHKYAKIRSGRNQTGAEVAREILDANGLTQVRIERIGGSLTDHFDPRTSVIRLSDSVYDSTSIAAIGVAAHETGHAIQYAKHYVPIKIRNAVLPVANLGTNIAWPLVVLGLLFGGALSFLMDVGILLFCAVVLFQLVTLPVEFNASARALDAIEERGMVNLQEKKGAARVLRAAALTYVAALAVSIGNLLRLLSLRNNRRD